MADGIALEGMKLINKWLLKAVKNGKDIEVIDVNDDVNDVDAFAS